MYNNPLRYRGYCYDEETEFYYLQSRYYDPTVGRFLNADDATYLGASETTLSWNAFAYCENDAINLTDDSGCFGLTILGITIGAKALATATMALTCLLLVTLTPGFINAWNNLCNDLYRSVICGLEGIGRFMEQSISWITSQAKSITKSIADSFAKAKSTPNYKHSYEVHHLVAKAAHNAVYAANILREVLPKKTEDPANKVSIKTGLHRRLHTNLYYGWANSVVISAYNSANGDKIKQRANVYTALAVLKRFVLKLDAISPY